MTGYNFQPQKGGKAEEAHEVTTWEEAPEDISLALMRIASLWIVLRSSMRLEEAADRSAADSALLHQKFEREGRAMADAVCRLLQLAAFFRKDSNAFVCSDSAAVLARAGLLLAIRNAIIIC